MKTSQFRQGKKLIQAWIPEDLLINACGISKKGFSETIVESLNHYVKSNKSNLELAIERYNNLILEATRLKTQIDELTNLNLGEVRKEIEKEILNENTPKIKELSEKERTANWEAKIKPLLKKKIAEYGIDNVLNDERMMDNFSKGLCISTGELKVKISTELV